METIKIPAFSFLLGFTVLFSQSGCKKAEISFQNSEIGQFKVFYDTLADPENYCVSMAAGYGKIFMAYGTSKLGTSNSYAYVFALRKSALIATDNKGNFLWKANIPDAMENNAVVALEDGGCMLITANFYGPNPKYSNRNLYFFRYDDMGNLNRIDSVPFNPAITEALTMRAVNAMLSKNGNIIAYGDVFTYKSGNSYGANSAWALEYSLNSGLVWLKSYLFYEYNAPIVYKSFTGCVETPDNGLLFSGYYNYMIFDTIGLKESLHPYLVKTNRSGDTLWTKKLSLANNYLYSSNIVANDKGTFWFGFTEYRTDDITMPTRTKIVELDQNGDSLNAVAMEHKTDAFIAKVLPTENGGCFALLTYATDNSIGYTRRTYFDKSQSQKAFFNASLKPLYQSYFQRLTTDYITQACYTSENRLACFGLQQGIGKNFYSPHLYIFK